MAVKSWATSDVGLRRSHNEDSCYANDTLGLYLVADGMGGHAAGEIASQAAVRTIHEFVQQAEADRDMTFPFGVDRTLSEEANILLTAVRLANQVIARMAAEQPELGGMGTTIAGVMIRKGKAHVFHVGDSRVYRLRKGRIEQLTADHSWVNEQLQRHMITEEEARTHRWRNVITRALGNKAAIEVDLKTHPIENGDILLLCTDGLSGLVSDQVILETILLQGQNLDQACQDLIAQANAAGGHDNITVVLVQYNEDTQENPAG
ncbi:MAG: Stp1/IreP family PP2C-type Ser/Thr phosphatase [Candidatus Sumerlaeia bacterium]|nr:Stp1/IreP family PP2C-type Ser/Thr phosphatase [Candidatus Sumerlaeia bacterium]